MQMVDKLSALAITSLQLLLEDHDFCHRTISLLSEEYQSNLIEPKEPNFSELEDKDIEDEAPLEVCVTQWIFLSNYLYFFSTICLCTI